jgi:hypothetical protein
MDETNRVLAVGVALVWIFLCLLVILMAWGAPDQSIERIGDLAGYLDDHNDTPAKLIITFGGLILALLGALVIVFEVAPPETGSLKVTNVGSGSASIGTDELTQRLEEELRQHPSISEVQAVVRGRGKKAEVKLDLYVAPEADLASTSEEACRMTRSLVEGRMGVQLAQEPTAEIHYRELRVGAARPASPLPPYAPPASEPAHDVPEAAREDTAPGA